MIELLPSREVAVNIGAWSIYWYGLLYVLAFGMSWWLLPRLQVYGGLKLKKGEWLEIVAWAAGGVLIGGRLGYVLLYGWDYYRWHIGEIFYLGQGGMASHGGFIGVGVALWAASRWMKIDYWRLLDVLSVPAAWGLALGRIGNVINQEIFTTAWAQAMGVGKDVIIGIICWWYLRRTADCPGKTIALFLVLYGTLRFLVEWVREQDYALVLGLTRGQWYTVPIIVVGVGLWWYFKQTDDHIKTTNK